MATPINIGQQVSVRRGGSALGSYPPQLLTAAEESDRFVEGEERSPRQQAGSSHSVSTSPHFTSRPSPRLVGPVSSVLGRRGWVSDWSTASRQQTQQLPRLWPSSFSPPPAERKPVWYTPSPSQGDFAPQSMPTAFSLGEGIIAKQMGNAATVAGRNGKPAATLARRQHSPRQNDLEETLLVDTTSSPTSWNTPKPPVQTQQLPMGAEAAQQQDGGGGGGGSEEGAGSNGGGWAGSVANDAIYGLILASMEIPCMVAYTQIIFKDAFFAPHMAGLLKLVFFSCMVHQSAFMMGSSLPFAVGSVQDAGLIFLR